MVARLGGVGYKLGLEVFGLATAVTRKFVYCLGYQTFSCRGGKHVGINFTGNNGVITSFNEIHIMARRRTQSAKLLVLIVTLSLIIHDAHAVAVLSPGLLVAMGPLLFSKQSRRLGS